MDHHVSNRSREFLFQWVQVPRGWNMCKMGKFGESGTKQINWKYCCLVWNHG